MSKINIRHSIFETNSSSTHSLQLMYNCNMNNIYDFIGQRISERYKEKDYYSCLDEDDYFIVDDDNMVTLVLSGIDFESSYESSCIYIVLKSWLAKVQYIAALLDFYSGKIYERYKVDDVTKSEIYESFVDAIKKSSPKQIDYIDYKFSSNSFNGKDCCKVYIEKTLTSFDGETIDTLKSKIYDILSNDDAMMMYMDEAYSPYDRPIIKIL